MQRGIGISNLPLTKKFYLNFEDLLGEGGRSYKKAKPFSRKECY